MWGLACALSKYPSLAGQDADDIANYVESVRPWRELPGIDDDETGRDQFIECWQKIKPGWLGKKAYMITLGRKEQTGDLPVVRPSGRVTKRFTEAVNIAYHLQQVEGSNPIVLSCRKLGDMMGIHFTNGDTYLRRMVNERFLDVVEPARKKMQRAPRYRFIGELVDGKLYPAEKLEGKER